MSEAERTGEPESKLDLIESVAHPVRRRAVLELQHRSDCVDAKELATVVATRVNDTDLVDVSRHERDRVHTELVHTHLQKLVEGGLVEFDPEARAVETTDHPALADDRFQRLLGVDADDWDDVLTGLQTERRRVVLRTLDAHDSLAKPELARRVAARERDGEDAPPVDRHVDDIAVSLHHVHLPILADAGLVDDHGTTVSYAGHPDLDAGLLSAVCDGFGGRGVENGDEQTDGESERRVHGERADVRTLDGREAIVRRGQFLFDEADEELFLMMTTDGLLEDECVSKLQDAVDRGVDVFVGSQTSAVRDSVREQIPGATIWEPQTDWLNLPPNRERLGRLVFADREAVMVGTLGERTADGYRETAITGEGRDNSLVVLLRQLLGTRLDHLDAQSADFRSEVPL